MSEQKRETIFDHNPTDDELKRFGGRETLEWAIAKAQKKGFVFPSNDSNNYMIGMLYSSRGNNEKANEYWSKIEDKNMLGTLVQDF